jgi:hypothetical protein
MGRLTGSHGNTCHTRSHGHAPIEQMFEIESLEHLFYRLARMRGFDRLLTLCYNGAKRH